MGQNVVIVVKPVATEGDHYYKIGAIVKTLEFNEMDLEILTSEVVLFKDELKELLSDKGLLFPLTDVKNRIKYIIYNSKIMYVDNKSSNFFDNILKLNCSNKI